MKRIIKIFSFALMITLCVCLCACDNDDNNNYPEDTCPIIPDGTDCE